MSQPHPEADPQVQDEPQAAQDAPNPPVGPLPPIPDKKKPVWHAGQVRNARYIQRFFHDPANFDARKFITPSDLAAAANIEGYYSDVQENELRWPASWEKDAAPLKRILAHSSWKDALRRCGIDPPDRNGPGSGKDNIGKDISGTDNSGGDGVVDGPSNGIDNNISDGVSNGAGGGFDNATNNGSNFHVSGNRINNSGTFNTSSDKPNSGGDFSEEDLSSSFAGARISNSNNTHSQTRPDLRHHASINKSSGFSKESLANSYPDMEQHTVNPSNAQDQHRPNKYFGQHASNHGGIFHLSDNRVNNNGEGSANSNADQNRRVVNSIDTRHQTRFNNSLGQHASNNGGGFNLGHQGLLHLADNSSQHLISSSKPAPYTMEPPAAGPKTADVAYTNAARGHGSVGASRIPADQALPAPRPMRVDQRPAVLNLNNRDDDEGYQASQNRRFERWWNSLSSERRREIVEESRQAMARGDGGDGGGEGSAVWVR